MSNRPHFDNALHMMEVQGGSFVKSLAHCYYMADQSNRFRLVAAFPDWFGEYEKRFQEHKKAMTQANPEAA